MVMTMAIRNTSSAGNTIGTSLLDRNQMASPPGGTVAGAARMEHFTDAAPG